MGSNSGDASRYLPEKSSEPVVREIRGEDELMRAVAQVYAHALGEARAAICLETPDAETQTFFREALTFLLKEDAIHYAAAEIDEGRGWVLHFLHNRSSIELRLADESLS